MALHGLFQSLFMSLFKLRTFRTGKKEQHRREELTQRNNKKMERLNNSVTTSVHVDIPQLHKWTYYFHHKTLHHFLSSSMWQAWDGNSRIRDTISSIHNTKYVSLQRFSTCDMNISWQNSHLPENSRNLLTTSRNPNQLERTKNIPVTKVQLFTMFPLCNHRSMQKFQTEMFFWTWNTIEWNKADYQHQKMPLSCDQLPVICIVIFNTWYHSKTCFPPQYWRLKQ